MRWIALAHLVFVLFCWKRERSRRRRIEARGGTADSNGDALARAGVTPPGA
jgi:hypothetical protein